TGHLKLHQLKFIQNLLEDFHMTGSDPIETPAANRKLDKADNKIPDMDISRYRTGVGKLMWLAKNTRPDIANAVRELARVMDCPTRDHE
ncbi:unnamed protein product, partial [Chrysoparadoxa australica]